MSIKQQITRLTTAINLHHHSELTYDQVASWVGSDATTDVIFDYIFDVERSSGKDGLSPKDVMDYCGEL